MRRPCRHAAPALGLVLPLVVAACGGREEPAAPSAPNIVLISVDTLNPAVLRAFDPAAAEHPNLDALAARSARFRNAVSAASWTLPAHASLLTGTYPDRHGATDPRRRIDAGVRTLAEELRAAGYETAAFTDAGYVAGEFGFARGFDTYDDRAGDGGFDPGTLPRGGRPNRLRGLTLFDRATAYLRARDPRRPLFLFLHTYSVHDYFRLHPWALRKAPRAGASINQNLRCLLGEVRGPDYVWKHLKSLYRAEVDHLDEGIGALLRVMESAGPGENTYVLLVSDHGEGFRPEAGRIHHGGRLHRDVLHVPLLVAGPGVIPQDVETPVSLVDVMPTVLGLAGAPPSGDLDGRTLLPVLRDSSAAPEPRPLFAMEHYHRWSGGRRLNAPDVRTEPLAVAVIDGSDWFLAESGEDGPAESRYDVRADPDQRNDLGADGPRAAKLRRMIRARLRVLPEVAPAEVDSALQAQLRSLGYVD